MNTAPGIIPCSNSSSSRMSRNVASARRGSASPGSISRISALVFFKSSRKLAIRDLNPTSRVGYSQRAIDRGSYPLDQGGKHVLEAVADDGIGDRIEWCLLGIQD